MITETLQPSPLLVDIAGAARLLAMGRSAFYSALSSGAIGPSPLRLNGGRQKFVAEELRRWCEQGCPPRTKWLAARPTGCHCGVAGRGSNG